MAKSKERSKKVPDYPSMVPAGTVIGIPIGDGKLAFGRVLSVNSGGVALIEVFRKIGGPGTFDESVFSSGWLVPPFAHTVDPITDDLEWSILVRGENFKMPEPQRDFEFVIGMWPLWYKQDVHQKSDGTKISAEEAARRLPAGNINGAGRMERIQKAVKEGRSWRPGEPDPEWAARVHRAAAHAKTRG